MGISFKTRVAQDANNFALQYKEVYVDYEYLICSDCFLERDYYIICAEADNFRHLLGVHTNLTALGFYKKCLGGRLTESDFDFKKKTQSEKTVKGTVRRKIQSFPHFLSMMNKELIVQEKFEKNKVICTIATTDCDATVGFVGVDRLRPKTLLQGDQIDRGNAGVVGLVLRKAVGDELFNEVLVGTDAAIAKYFPKIKGVISRNLYLDELLVENR